MIGNDLSRIFCRFLDANKTEAINDTVSEIHNDLAAVLETHPIDTIVSNLFAISEPSSFDYLPSAIFDCLNDIENRHGASVLGRYKKCLIIHLIGSIDARISTLELPKSVLDRFPDTVGFVVDDLLSTADQDYLNEHFEMIRELRLASLRSLPCGALTVDNYTSLPSTTYRYNGAFNNIKCFWFIYTKLGGLGPVYRRHVELRGAENFDERSVDASYLRVADLMRLNPHIRGLIGSGWLYDPQLESISPHLAYQRRRPVDSGAYLRHDGPGRIKLATQTSRTRRKLYEKGEYLPEAHTFIWARADLLRWAESVDG